MLRGPYLYPTVATYWVDDVEITGLTRSDYVKTLRRLQDRATRRRLATDEGGRPDESTAWRSRPLTPADRRARVRFNEITGDDVTDYIRRRDDGSPRADRSRDHVLGIVWQLYNWATDPAAGELCATTPGPLVASNPAARLRAQGQRTRRSPRDVIKKTWLNKDWARVLIATTRGDTGRAVDRRDAVLIALYLYTGLRLAELIRVRWRDVDLSAGDYGGINVIRKGGKRGVALLNEAARRELFSWRAVFVEAVGENIDDLGIIPQTRSVPTGTPTTDLEVCVNTYAAGPAKRSGDARYATCPRCAKRVRITLTGTLWAHGTRRGAERSRDLTVLWTRRITSGCAVREIVASRAEAAGITHLRPHDLRRSYAGIMEDAGADLREIQAGLGHSHLETTERYLKQRTKLATAARGIDFG